MRPETPHNVPHSQKGQLFHEKTRSLHLSMCLVQQGTECFLYTASYLICTMGLRSRQGRCELHCVLKKMIPTRLNVCEKSTFPWMKEPEWNSWPAQPQKVFLSHTFQGLERNSQLRACNRHSRDVPSTARGWEANTPCAQSVTPRGPKFPACFKPVKSV